MEIAVIGAGAMGSAIARRLVENGAKVVTYLESRSPATIERARAAGMEPVGLDAIATSPLILSIVPPAEAVAVAGQVASTLRRLGTRTTFIDCNAISPRTMTCLLYTSMRFDLSKGQIPIFTTKRVYWKLAVKEMLWFLTGDTNIRNLLKENVRIWTDWPLAKYRKATGEDIDQVTFEKRILEDEAFALQWGDLGPVYGKQWRQWRDAEGRVHDQVATVIRDLKTNPSSRRMIFHAWNVGELADMALHPCHMVYQFHVSNISGEGGKRPRLSLMVFQRDVYKRQPWGYSCGSDCTSVALIL